MHDRHSGKISSYRNALPQTFFFLLKIKLHKASCLFVFCLSTVSAHRRISHILQQTQNTNLFTQAQCRASRAVTHSESRHVRPTHLKTFLSLSEPTSTPATALLKPLQQRMRSDHRHFCETCLPHKGSRKRWRGDDPPSHAHMRESANAPKKIKTMK